MHIADKPWEPRCVWPVGAELGEGPCWSAPEGALWFVDIDARKIHRLDHASGAKRSWPAPDKVSFILPEEGGLFIVGIPGALARFAPDTGTFEPILTLERTHPHNRLNDACVDTFGRLWFGSMDGREIEPNGGLYFWDGKTAPLLRDAGYEISNGPAFSPDGKIFYHTNTLARTIYRFDVADGARLSSKRPFIEIEEGAGWPDGSAIDAEGCIWIALFGGWQVRRYSAAGELLTSIALPCANVTKLAFGGEDLRTAFVTTARRGLKKQELDAQPHAGGLFSFRVDSPGLPQPVLSKT